MTLRDFRIKLENILLDYNIHVTQKIESDTLSVFLLDRSYINESEEINNKIKELVSSNKIQANLFSEHTDFDFYSTRNHDAILAVIKGNELDYFISDCDNSEDGLLKIDFSEIDDLIKPEVVEDYKAFTERNYLDYINLIKYLSEVFGKAEPNNEMTMTPDKLYDYIDKTIYINVSNEVDTIKLKEVSDKINKDSICTWNLRSTQVIRDNKFVISCMFSRNPYNKNQDLFIKVDDPNNIFSVISNSFTSGKDIKYLLWLSNERKVFSQDTEIIHFTTNYPRINLEINKNLGLSKSLEFPCHVKIYKYIVEESNNEITKGKQEVLFESKNVLIYPSVLEPYLPEYSMELDLDKLMTHITEVSNKILDLNTPHSVIGYLQYLLSHIHEDSLDLSEVHKLLTDVKDKFNLNNIEFNNSATSPNLYTIKIME